MQNCKYKIKYEVFRMNKEITTNYKSKNMTNSTKITKYRKIT